MKPALGSGLLLLACEVLACRASPVASSHDDDGGGAGGGDAAAGMVPRKILDERAVLSGTAATTCSHQEPASGNGDRWCAFRMPGAAPDTTELWVIDLTVAALGGAAPPPCDGSSPACRRLTSTLWPSYTNDFEGDTLIYYADAPEGQGAHQPFVGPAYAWRPGWSQPRVIATHALVCNGHRKAPVAVCLDNPAGNPGNPDTITLLVGELADVTGLVLPALPGRWPGRSDGSVPWQIGFSPDGATFAVSAPDTAPFVQNLSVIATNPVAAGALRKKVIADVNRWTISNDGAKIFFTRGPSTDATLTMADFPAGTGETVIASQVVEFLPLGRAATDGALLLRVHLPAGGHAFQLLRDRALPSSAQTVFTNEGFLEGLLVSPDLAYTAWIDPEFRGRVIRNADLTTCALNGIARPPVFDLAFLDDGGLVFWTEPGSAGLSRRDGFLAPPDRCSERVPFAQDLAFFTPISHLGLVFGDERDDTAQTLTLRYASLALAGDRRWPAQGSVRVQERVTAPVRIVSGGGGGATTLLYRAEADGTRQAGIYVFGPLPF
jgi:hypothetical protein